LSAVRRLRSLRLLSDRRRLEQYPPFEFMGIEVMELAPDRRRVRLRLSRYDRCGGVLCAPLGNAVAIRTRRSR